MNSFQLANIEKNSILKKYYLTISNTIIIYFIVKNLQNKNN